MVSLVFWLHVEKLTKRHVFPLWRDVTASRHQAKPGLASGCGWEAPFRFGGVEGDTKLSYGESKGLLPGVFAKCTPRANNDARRRKDAACPNGHKAGHAGRWGTAERAPAPATGCPPSSSHASVAPTATRPSSQDPASALRFNYYWIVFNCDDGELAPCQR